MKYFLILLALMPLALGEDAIRAVIDANDRSISSQIVDAIEAAKEQMPCGFPGLGIPPLAPLKISHKEINIDGESIKAHGEINDFRLDGLNDFDVVEFKLSTILSRVTFKFNWNHVFLTTNYDMATDINMLSPHISGLAKFAIKNLQVWGEAKYSLGILSGNIKLKSFNLYVSVEHVNSEIEGLSKYSIINKKLNQIIEEWVYLAINDNTENISDLTNGYLVPAVNDMIGDMSLSDLLGLIAGGGGSGSGSASQGEKEVCVPEN
ncbi:uncharacterized protein LOC142224598 [Haematobia irritans]|uniref:Putative juvenile hormone binding protein in insects n=1 Tax=Haematobia irritans TaxID=7368 RepID=A0A1L8EGN0_HAEIR